jgi:uncharacterized membrane protein YqgA involved in biofilm formation
MRATVLSGVGLMVLVIGVQQALKTRNVVFPLVALIAGGIAGELLRIEDRLDALPASTDGFVAASLVFCVGPLTILGAIKDGLGGADHAQLLFVKAALDGLVAMVFASTLGWGVALSAITIVVVQGGLTLFAGAADRALTTRMIDELSATGGVMIIGIGLRLLDVKRVRVGSFLPALVVAPLLVGAFAR